MTSAEIMVRQGNWLFRYRSYLPVVLVVLGLGVMWLYRGIYGGSSFLLNLSCLLVSLSGEVIRVLAVGYAADNTSGRNTKQQVADEINSTGIYSLVRHPLYIGNFFMWLGIVLYIQVPWFTLVFILMYCLYYERIILAEEAYLTGKFGESYPQYSAHVNAVLPRFAGYVQNKYCFRIKKVLRQENSSLYAMIVTFLLTELATNFFHSWRVHLQWFWIVVGAVGTLLYLVLRFLKKQTKLLKNDGQRLR